MKQLHQQYSHYNSKAWTSLDCLLTSPPIQSSSRTLMRSNINLPLTDTRRISPQTTSSSGYHSDLSSATSTNQSPQSIHEIIPVTIEKSPSSSSHSYKQSIHNHSNSNNEKFPTHKNLSRLSSFLRRQYERARSKLSSTNQSTSSHTLKIQSSPSTAVTTCSKATSTTPLSHLSQDRSGFSHKQQNSNCHSKPHYHPQYLSAVYKQSSYSEPVYSIYVRPKYSSNAQANYAPIHECYSQGSSQHRSIVSHSAMKNSHSYSSSYRQPTMNTSYYESKNTSHHRYDYYPVQSSNYEHYYPYRSRNHPKSSYEPSRSTYAPLSDFVSTRNSAFKPIDRKRQEFRARPTLSLYEQVPPSDDPCDLEVAQYFPQTCQWSNPNYFDIYTQEISLNKTHYNETLC